MKHLLFVLMGFLVSLGAIAEEPAKASVLLKTSLGEIVVELDVKAAPDTCKNFLQYVDEGFYNNTIFHRVITDFMVQGGGFERGMLEKPAHAPIKNESANGLKNTRGAVAMARTQDPNSASAQFFINVVDNAYLDGSPAKPGYAVFGNVIRGMDVIDKMTTVATGTQGMHRDVPIEDILLLSVSRLPPESPKAP